MSPHLHLPVALLAAALALAPAGARGATLASPGAIEHYVRARLAEARGDGVRALREVELALAFDEDAPELRLAHAELLLRAGQSLRAEGEARRALEAGAPPAIAARARLLLGRVASADGGAQRAARELREAARLEAAAAAAEHRRPDPEAWRRLAVLLARARDEAGAVAALEDLARHLPAEAAEGFLGLAGHAGEAKDAARAERHLRRASALAPSDPRAWKGLAALAAARGDDAAARAAWESAARADPDDPEILLAVGSHAARAGDAAAARAWFHELLDAEVDPGAARAAAALAWLEAGEVGEALPLLEGAVAARPQDPAARFALGAARELGGDAVAALADMRVVLALDPDHADALNFVAYTLAERGERLDEAERLVRRALELRPETPAYLDSLGWVLFRGGDYAGAVRALERAVALGPPDGTVLEHLGDAYRRAGREADAADAYRRALAALAAPAPRSLDPAARRETQRTAIERKMQETVSLR